MEQSDKKTILNQKISLYKKAADQGDTEAQYALGLIFDKKKDYEQAVFWYKKAAELGHIDAQCNLQCNLQYNLQFHLAIYGLTKDVKHEVVQAEETLGRMVMAQKMRESKTMNIGDEKFWSDEVAVSLANNDQLKLTVEHWEIINYIRGFGEGFGAYNLLINMEKKFGKEKFENIKKLFKLKKYKRKGEGPFPYRAVRQAASYAQINLNKIIVNSRIYQLDSFGYLLNRQDWQPEFAEKLAILDDVNLTKKHWIVIDIVRNYFDGNEVAPSVRRLRKEMEKYFGEVALNPRYKYLLFPYGSQQLFRYAGLPHPHGSI